MTSLAYSCMNHQPALPNLSPKMKLKLFELNNHSVFWECLRFSWFVVKLLASLRLEISMNELERETCELINCCIKFRQAFVRFRRLQPSTISSSILKHGFSTLWTLTADSRISSDLHDFIFLNIFPWKWCYHRIIYLLFAWLKQKE